MSHRSLVDTVYALKDEMKALQCKISNVSLQLEEEKTARGQLQSIIRSLLVNTGRPDIHTQYLALQN